MIFFEYSKNKLCSFNCFSCKAHGNVLDFVVAIEEVSLKEAEEERIAFIETKYTQEKLAASIGLLGEHILLYEQFPDDKPLETLTEYVDLMAEIRADMVTLNLTKCVLSLDSDIVIKDNTTSIIKRNKGNEDTK